MIKRPDEYGHNNPDYAMVDAGAVRGGGRVVANLTALYAIPLDLLKERVTKVYVTAETITYVLKDIANYNNANGWEVESTGGASIDDTSLALDKTWSAYKTAEELSGKEAAGTAQNLVTQLIDGATDNTLKKLQDKITAINAIIGGSTADGDNLVNTVAELLAVFSSFPEGADMVTLLTAKLNTSDVYNALDRVLEGKALDARQGKVLNDLIAELREDLDSFTPTQPKELLISKSTFNSIAEPGIYKNNAIAKNITGHRLTTNATDFSITVAGTTYTNTATYPIALPANAELIINDVTIQTGYNIGNVILIIE